MPGETVKLQVELVEKNAEARLKALDKLAKEMGNRKITLNFDEASLARWKAATDGMTSAQLSAYAKLATAAENASAKMIAAGQKTTQVEMQQNAKLAIDRQKSFDKKISLYEKEDTKRRQIAEKTAQTEINANAKVEAAALKGARGTKQQTSAQKELNAEAQKTSGIFDSLTKRFTAANLISAAVTRGITLLRNALRQAVDEMKEMDKELTTIKMVTGASDTDISALRQQAFAGARETGRTTSDYLSAAERFARAGYRENIQDLTKLSLVTQNVGGVTEDVASKFILAADAAWKMGGSTERLWSMLDGVTSIADQNATDIGKIAEAYTVAGSAFANAGESERTFAALIGTTTAATQRSGSEMARGLQTILFRVRQVKGELDDGEIINASDISNAAKALDSVGISVLNDAKELKSFTEIMGELNEKWDTLNTKEKAYLQNALAGNRRGNVLFSLMDNYDVYQRQLEQFDESSGTALEKNAIHTESWAAATNKLSTAWTNLIGVMTSDGGILKDTVSWLGDAVNYIAKLDREAAKRRTQQREDNKLQAYLDFKAGDQELFHALYTDEEIVEYERRIKETEKSQNELAEATIQVIKSYDDEAEAVDQLSTAFEKSTNKIKAAAEAMKSEKDDSIKSAADIYKAMKEAADKGYYGSYAYQEGARLFFGTSDKDAIGKIAQESLDTYFGAIAQGDYSNAAAALWGNFADASGQIVDQATGEVIASMTDLGDSYQWAFNKGEKSIDEFLQSMQDSTGIGSDFWASMIQSLGMYSDEMDKWMEENKEIPEPELKIQTDSAEEEVKTAVDNINAMLDGIKDKTVKVNIIQSISGMNVSDATDTTLQAYAAYYRGWTRPQKASGKHDRFSGIALVNDEFPADGSTPELIISKSQGRAYIANGGRPALVNLRSDDVVLTASETKSAFGIPGFSSGTNDDTFGRASTGGLLGNLIGNAIQTAVTKTKDTISSYLDGVVTTSPKNPENSNSGGGGGGGGGGAAAVDASDSWATLKKLVDYLLDKGNDDLKDQLKVLDDQLAELEAERKAQEESNKLQERQEAVQQALLDLNKAQVERTVRYYNEETQQWEWMADKGAVQKAQEAYDKALKDLNEYLSDQDYEARKAEIRARKDELKAQFEEYEKSWAAIVDAIEAPAGDVKAILEEIKKNGTSTMIEQSGGIAELLNNLRDGLVSLGYVFGLGNINANTTGSTTTSETVFDNGGFAFGTGFMRKGNGAETVIGPELTRDILNPVKNARFSAFADSLRCIMDGVGQSPSFRGASNITNNNGGNYYVNGVKVGQDMAQRPFAEVMRTIAIHANENR